MHALAARRRRHAERPSALAISDGRGARGVYEDRWGQRRLQLPGAPSATCCIDTEANDTAADFVREQDPPRSSRTRTPPRLLAPTDHPIGTKRLCVDTGYYDTFNRANVTLVDMREDADRGDHARRACAPPSAALRARRHRLRHRLRRHDRRPRWRIDIRGRGGAALQRGLGRRAPQPIWACAWPGFPNLFIITGPGSPSVLTNMVVSIEQHVDWIADCIAYLGDRQLGGSRPPARPQDAWVAHVNEVAASPSIPWRQFLVPGRQRPGQAPGVHALFGGFGPYRESCEAVAANDYEGFALRSAVG